MYFRTIMSSSGGTLPGAVLFASDAEGRPIAGGASATADKNGFVTINLPNPDVIVTARYIGHEPQTKPLRQFPGVIVLKDINELKEIEVTAKRSYYLYGTLFALFLIYALKNK